MPPLPDDKLSQHEDSVTQTLRDGKANTTIGLQSFEAANGDQKSFYRDASFDSGYNDSDNERGQSSHALPSLLPRPTGFIRRVSFVEEDEVNTIEEEPAQKSEQPVTWMSLPHKGQLAILTLARLSEPLTQTSLLAYLFYQVKSFDPSLPDSSISKQTGLLQATFTAAQFVTAMLWGRAADSERIGRKRVLIIGLFGTCIASIGFGFSRTLFQAAVFRTLGGALNGNVGVMRTMISEIIKEKKYQSRAFLLLPMCFNIGVIIGPIVGGLLADPVHNYPHVFGDNSVLGGKNGVWWMKHWPYLLPNLISAIFILISTFGVIFGLEETHYRLKGRPDFGIKVGKYLGGVVFRRSASHKYAPLDTVDDMESPVSIRLQSRPSSSRDLSDPAKNSSPSPAWTSDTQSPPAPTSSPKKKVWTRNVLLTLLTHFILAFHISAFNALIFIFLPTPRSKVSAHGTFTGGLGLPASQVGLATAIIGVMGLPLQLMVYPAVQSKLGTLPSYRTFLPFSALAYSTIPLLVLVPRHPFVLVWVALTLVLALQVLSRTFALPSAIILVNNSIEDPGSLSTVHGVAQSVSSGSRTLGPMLAGWGFGWGLTHDMGGVVWWCLAGVVVCGWGMSWLIKEGQGIMVDENEEQRERTVDTR